MTNPAAFLLFDRPASPDVAAVVDSIRRNHPGIPSHVPADPALPKPPANSSLLVCGGEILVIMSIPAPLPADENLLVRTLPAWATARASFRQHKAHLIVTVVGSKAQQLPVARVITAVIGALIATMPGCLGVVWGGNVAYPTDRWKEMSKAAFAIYPYFPAGLWISKHPFRDERTGGVGAVTQGLSRFVGRELELVGLSADLKSLLDRMDGLVTYLIEKGPVLKDGSTFGVSETERVAVSLRTSERFPGLAVIAGSLAAIERQVGT